MSRDVFFKLSRTGTSYIDFYQWEVDDIRILEVYLHVADIINKGSKT